MAAISIGPAIATGFGLIRRRPLSVLAWGLIPTVLSALTLLALAPYYAELFGRMRAGALLPTTAATGKMLMLQGIGQLLNLAQLLAAVVVYCAVFRAVLKPEQSRFAYLRLGAPELLLMMLGFAWFITFFIVTLVVIVPVATIGVLVSVGARDAGVGITVWMLIALVAALIALLVVSLRFSLVGPMIVDDGRFHFGESWTLTRGRLGPLFLLGLSLLGLLLIGELIYVGAIGAIGFAALGAAAGGFGRIPIFLQSPLPTLMGKLAPFVVAYLIVLVPLSGCVAAIFGAPWAKVYQDLKPNSADAFA